MSKKTTTEKPLHVMASHYADQFYKREKELKRKADASDPITMARAGDDAQLKKYAKLYLQYANK